MGTGRAGFRSALGVLVVGSAVALCAAAAPSPGGPSEYTLANGMQVIDAQDARTDQAAVVVRYPIGWAEDPPDHPGVARLMATLLQRASTRHVRRGDRDDVIRAVGFTPWQPAVDVEPGCTVFRVLVPVRALRLALWLGSDRAGYFSDGIDHKSVSDAISQLETAYKQFATKPFQALWYRAQLEAYGPDDSYGHDIDLGALRRLSPAELRQRARTLYGADHAVVSVVGAANPADVRKWVGQYFGTLPRTALSRPPRHHPRPQHPPRRYQMTGPAHHPWIALSWRTPGYFTPDDLALDAAARILVHRLAVRLIEPHIAARVAAREVSHEDASAFVVEAEADSGHDVAELRAAIEDEIRSLASGRFDASYLGAARSLLALETASTREQPGARARGAADSWVIDHDLQYPAFVQQHYAALTAGTVAAAVKRELPLPAQAVGILRPGAAMVFASSASRRENPARLKPLPALRDEAFRYAPPPTAKAGPFTPPVPREARLPNGARLLFLAQPGSDRVWLSTVLRWRGKPPPCCGARDLLGRVLEMSKLRDGRQLQEASMAIGSVLGVAGNFNPDAMWINVAARPQDLQKAATLATQALLVGDLDAATFDRLAKERREREQTPADRFLQYQWNAIYPAGRRYHLPLPGETGKLTAASLSRYLHGQVSASQVTYVVTGDTTFDEVQKSLVRASKPLPARPRPRTQPALHNDTGAFLFDDPALKGVHVSVTVPVPGWTDPDFAAVLALPDFFGNGSPFLPHLHEIGVQRHGVVTASISYPADLATLNVECSLPEKGVPLFVRAVFDEMEQLRQGTIPAALFGRARRKVLRGIRDWSYANPSSVHRELLMMATRGNAADTEATVYRRGSLVDAALVQRIAKQYLMRDHATVVAYGPVAAARSGLEKLGLHVVLRRVAGKSGNP